LAVVISPQLFLGDIGDQQSRSIMDFPSGDLSLDDFDDSFNLDSMNTSQDIPSMKAPRTVLPTAFHGNRNYNKTNNSHSPNKDPFGQQDVTMPPPLPPPSRATSSGPRKDRDPMELSADYVPGNDDVVAGRGKRNWNHPGNIQFRNIVRSHVPNYVEAITKAGKTHVVVVIVQIIRDKGGYFLQQNPEGKWYDIGDHSAREKVGHSLRDHVTSMQKLSDKEKTVKSFFGTKGLEKQQLLQNIASNSKLGGGPAGTRAPPKKKLSQFKQAVAEHRGQQRLGATQQSTARIDQQFFPQLDLVISKFEQQDRELQQVRLSMMQPRFSRTTTPVPNLGNSIFNPSMGQQGPYNYQQEPLPAPQQDEQLRGLAARTYSFAGSFFHQELDSGNQSDGEGEMALRRSSLMSTKIVDGFGRRPSLLGSAQSVDIVSEVVGPVVGQSDIPTPGHVSRSLRRTGFLWDSNSVDMSSTFADWYGNEDGNLSKSNSDDANNPNSVANLVVSRSIFSSTSSGMPSDVTSQLGGSSATDLDMVGDMVNGATDDASRDSSRSSRMGLSSAFSNRALQRLGLRGSDVNHVAQSLRTFGIDGTGSASVRNLVVGTPHPREFRSPYPVINPVAAAVVAAETHGTDISDEFVITATMRSDANVKLADSIRSSFDGHLSHILDPGTFTEEDIDGSFSRSMELVHRLSGQHEQLNQVSEDGSALGVDPYGPADVAPMQQEGGDGQQRLFSQQQHLDPLHFHSIPQQLQQLSQLPSLGPRNQETWDPTNTSNVINIAQQQQLLYNLQQQLQQQQQQLQQQQLYQPGLPHQNDSTTSWTTDPSATRMGGASDQNRR
jgi:hypothetical protein